MICNLSGGPGLSPGRKPLMNAKAATTAVTAVIDDVQSRADTRRLPINRVGIKDIYHPVRVKDRSRGEQHTIANFNMYVALPHNFKVCTSSKGKLSANTCAGKATPNFPTPSRCAAPSTWMNWPPWWPPAIAP